VLTRGPARAERTRLRMAGEAGIVGANLAITLAFALYAVIQLSRTTLAAQQIDDRVEVIVGETTPINEDLVNVPKLDETVRIAADINDAARPLSAQADQIIAAARSIDGTVSNILGNAQSIGGSVGSISGTVNALTPVVRSINDGVAGINGRVDRAIELARGIQNDLAAIVTQVGFPAGPAGHRQAGGGLSIHGHANSINCSTAINGPNCER
jgi:hypothetical protein